MNIKGLELFQYASLVRNLPRPTPDQMLAFARYVSNAHSWYKHLPWFPPGAPFYFFLDPAAGMQRAVAPNGSVRVSVREEPGFHYSWIRTEEYRARFGQGVYGPDGAFDSEGVPPRCGGAALLKRLIDRQLIALR